MQLYEIITRIMELSGMTFDETFTYFTLVMIGSITGFGFFLSTCFDLGRCLYRIVKELFLLLLSKLRHKGSGEV